MAVPGKSEWSIDEWEQIAFDIEERAAIREFDGGETREDAERNARREVMERWHKYRT